MIYHVQILLLPDAATKEPTPLLIVQYDLSDQSGKDLEQAMRRVGALFDVTLPNMSPEIINGLNLQWRRTAIVELASQQPRGCT